jgi:hypothetical protein
MTKHVYQHIRSGQSPSNLALNQNSALISRPYCSRNSEHENVLDVHLSGMQKANEDATSGRDDSGSNK